MKQINGCRPEQLTKKIASRIKQGGYSEFFRINGMGSFWHHLSFYLNEFRLQNKPELTIIVAGCSSGEEAYSIALMVKRLGLDITTKVRIIGLDRDQRRIAQAQKGEYRCRDYLRPLSGVIPEDCHRFFRGLDNAAADRVSVTADLKAITSFHVVDVLSTIDPALRGAADFVTVNNLIGRNRHEQERLLSGCVSLCRPAGLLLMNKGYVVPVKDHPEYKVLIESKDDLVLQATPASPASRPTI